MKTLSRLGLLLAASALSHGGLAQTNAPAGPPFLSPLFTDNMVLQRGLTDPIWGWTTPGASVTVSIAGKSTQTVAGTDGKWTAKLPPLPVGGPYTLTATGPQSETRQNVLVGDVWVCSGQSNMEFGVGNLLNAAQEISQADYPQIRLYRVKKTIALAPQDTAIGSWEVCTPDNLKADGDWLGFSAVGYFFGRDLYQDLHIPIGLIHTSWGGTPAQAWTSEQALQQKVPDYRPQLTQLDAEREANQTGGPQSLTTRLAAWYQKNDPGSANGPGWADPALDDSAWNTMTLPGYFQQAGIPELAGVNGVVWFRKVFDVPDGAAGKDLVLHFYADDNDTTWVNGTQVGATEGFNVARAYTIPASLLKPTGNVIAVRVLDTGGDGGIYGQSGSLSLQAPGDSMTSLAGAWRVRLGANLAKTTPLPVAIENNPNFSTVLYNGMVNPLIPYGIKGAIWYQGESNAGQAYQYRTLLPTMIRDWQGRWGEGNFPFLIVQLAGWEPGGDSWPELREAQWLTAKTVPNAGIATAIDVGDRTDIHPKNKQEVGRRLALVARAKVYHEKVEYYGPVYKSMKTDGGTIRLTFDHLGGGLTAKDGGPLTAFTIAGPDHTFVPADAKIDGDAVVVSSPQVSQPVAVRYAWSAYPSCSLYSKDGLPAFPFRTDDLPGITDHNK